MATDKCPHCGGSGWVVTERNGVATGRPCACREAVRAEETWHAAGIPLNYAKDSFDNFRIPTMDEHPVAHRILQQAMTIAAGYTMEFPVTQKPGLLFAGDAGCGKTHMAVATVRRLIDKGHSAVFWDYQTLIESIRASYNEETRGSNKDAYQSALDAEILMLDDLGAYRSSDWVEDVVTGIITYRCNERKPLIATTNLPDEEMGGTEVKRLSEGSSHKFDIRKTLSEAIGGRARSRLFEMCTIVKMFGAPDYRVTRAAR
jgi:DNA replication protein DnaC